MFKENILYNELLNEKGGYTLKRVLLNIAIFVICIISFTACSISKRNVQIKDVEKKSFQNYPKQCKDNEKIIYNIYQQKLVKYDLNKKKITEFEENDYFQYAFPKISNLFTSGNSITNNFEIIEIEDGKRVKSLINVGKNEAIFPLASDKQNNYYVHYFYDKNNNEYSNKRCICEYVNGKIQDYNNSKVPGKICNGAIYENELYITVADNSQKISIYSIQLDSIEGQPKLIKSNVSGSGILGTKLGVLYENNHFLFLENDKDTGIEENTDIYADQNSQYVFDIRTENSSVTLNIHNVETGEKILSMGNIIGYEINNDKIIMYGDGFMKEEELE